MVRPHSSLKNLTPHHAGQVLEKFDHSTPEALEPYAEQGGQYFKLQTPIINEISEAGRSHCPTCAKAHKTEAARLKLTLLERFGGLFPSQIFAQLLS